MFNSYCWGFGVLGFWGFGGNQTFRNDFENVKSGFPKCRNVKNPGFQTVNSGILKWRNVKNPRFQNVKMSRLQVFKVSGIPKGRIMPAGKRNIWFSKLNEQRE